MSEKRLAHCMIERTTACDDAYHDGDDDGYDNEIDDSDDDDDVDKVDV